MSWDIESFREKVESQHKFPGFYTFKFIVPSDQKDAILGLLPESEISYKHSANNKYLSISAKAKLKSSQEVLDVYMSANNVQGCIAL